MTMEPTELYREDGTPCAPFQDRGRGMATERHTMTFFYALIYGLGACFRIEAMAWKGFTYH